MTVTDPSSSALTDSAPGLRERLSQFLRSLFAPASASGQDTGSEHGTEVESASAYVIAPGGYRIRVPQAGDLHHSIGEMLPSVRQGLSVVPPLPYAVTELLREIQDPNASAASVARIASSDPALAASLIRTVNTAAFGLHRKITSAAEAVSYLGFSSVKSIVLRLQLDATLGGKGKSNQNVEDLWTHSLVVSYIADTLARRVPGVDRGFVSTLGLLHDIGKLVVQTQFPKEAAALHEMKSTSGSEEGLLARETRVLGVDHAELGANLGSRWNLPADLVRAIRWHHFPERAFEPGDPRPLHQAMYLLQIANQLAKYVYAYDEEMEIDAISEAAFDAIGFPHDLTALLDNDVRAAAGRAIFFSNEGVDRSKLQERRFLRLNHGSGAARLLEAMGCVTSAAPQIALADDPAGSLFCESVEGPTRFSEPASEEGAKKLLEQLAQAMESIDLSDDSQPAISLVSRCVLASIVAHARSTDSAGEKIEIALHKPDKNTFIAFRAGALGFARRFGPQCQAAQSSAMLQSELANVINLGWFESITSSSDGCTLLLTTKAA